MQTRPLGKTGHDSTIFTFGAIALNYLEQEGADQLIEHVLDYGVNHFDVAPSYGDAELKLGPKVRQHRSDVFLGCKTQKRDYDGAKRSLERSLDRLGIDHIELYQIHGLEAEYELDAITGEDGALDAFREAKDEGVIDHLGLTSHGDPRLVLDALDRIDDLETVMFPMNPVVAGKDGSKHDYEAVLDRANELNVATLGIKAFAKRPWPSTEELPERNRPFANWYEPVDRFNDVRERFDYAASSGLTSVVSPGDPKLVSMVLQSADRYGGMSESARQALVEDVRQYETAVPEQLHH